MVSKGTAAESPAAKHVSSGLECCQSRMEIDVRH